MSSFIDIQDDKRIAELQKMFIVMANSYRDQQYSLILSTTIKIPDMPVELAYQFSDVVGVKQHFYRRFKE